MYIPEVCMKPQEALSTLQENVPEMSDPGKKTASAPSVVNHVYSILRKEY